MFINYIRYLQYSFTSLKKHSNVLFVMFFKRRHCSAKYEGGNDGDVDVPCFFFTIRSFNPPHQLSMRCVCAPLVKLTQNWK